MPYMSFEIWTIAETMRSIPITVQRLQLCMIVMELQYIGKGTTYNLMRSLHYTHSENSQETHRSRES